MLTENRYKQMLCKPTMGDLIGWTVRNPLTHFLGTTTPRPEIYLPYSSASGQQRHAPRFRCSRGRAREQAMEKIGGDHQHRRSLLRPTTSLSALLKWIRLCSIYLSLSQKLTTRMNHGHHDMSTT
jgi:hypothetical protein